MAIVLNRRRACEVSMMLRIPTGWFTWGHSARRRRWTRRNLTPQERAYLWASYTPPAVITASLSGHVV